MCQLLGMNCNVPTDICFSFDGFCERGGRTGEHTDGWGIGFFEGRGCRLFLDANPSALSPVAEFVKRYPIKTYNAIAHIRKATHGGVGLENTHPFKRELWGRYWLFAHNGELQDFAPPSRGLFVPVGSTDSERAFCLLLERLHAAFPQGMPPIDALLAALHPIIREIGAHGIFNFLMGNERFLFAHCSTKLQYLVRRAPFSTARLADKDVVVDFSTVTTPTDAVAIIATEPLTTNEKWIPMNPHELLVFFDGQPLAAARTGDTVPCADGGAR